jgi:hypothetical protein
MTELAGSAHISFEGDLSACKLTSLEGFSAEETAVLQRNTLWPRQDFAVVPLKPSMEVAILAAMGGTVSRKILHIQIEKDGRLEFGSYDTFHPECFTVGSGLTSSFIERLWSEGVIGPRKHAEAVAPARTANLSTPLRSGRDDKS